jgi:hypothetical protein
MEEERGSKRKEEKEWDRRNSEAGRKRKGGNGRNTG